MPRIFSRCGANSAKSDFARAYTHAALPIAVTSLSSSTSFCGSFVALSMSRRKPRTFAACVGFSGISVSARYSSFSVRFEVSSACALPVRYESCRARCSSAFSGM